jgi:hypothetical protein
VGVQFSSMPAIEIFDSRGRRTLALYGHDDKRCAGISVRRARSSVSPDLREHIRPPWASSGVSRARRRTANEIPKTPSGLDWRALNRYRAQYTPTPLPVWVA